MNSKPNMHRKMSTKQYPKESSNNTDKGAVAEKITNIYLKTKFSSVK